MILNASPEKRCFLKPLLKKQAAYAACFFMHIKDETCENMKI
jgi:hypothetical protein